MQGAQPTELIDYLMLKVVDIPPELGTLVASVKNQLPCSERDAALALRQKQLRQLQVVGAKKIVLERFLECVAVEGMKLDATLSGDALTEAIGRASQVAGFQVFCTQPIGLQGYPLDSDRVVTCIDYCFDKVGEKRALPYYGKAYPVDFYRDPATFLLKWGYEKVEKPSAGNLAIYTGAPDLMKVHGLPKTTGIFKHMGMVQADGQIESKWGHSGWVMTHPVEVVPKQYGRCTLFFAIEI